MSKVLQSIDLFIQKRKILRVRGNHSIAIRVENEEIKLSIIEVEVFWAIDLFIQKRKILRARENHFIAIHVENEEIKLSIIEVEVF
jgi:hypothetical protein